MVVEWRHHSEQAGTTRRATVPRNGGLQPKDWRAPTQGLAGAIFLTRSGSTTCPNCSWLTCPRTPGGWYLASCVYSCIPGFLLFSLAHGVPSRLTLGFAGSFNRLAFNGHSADSTLAVVLTLVLVGMPVSVCRNASLQFHAELSELMVMLDICERTAKSGNEWDCGVGGTAPIISGVFV